MNVVIFIERCGIKKFGNPPSSSSVYTNNICLAEQIGEEMLVDMLQLLYSGVESG